MLSVIDLLHFSSFALAPRGDKSWNYTWIAHCLKLSCWLAK